MVLSRLWTKVHEILRQCRRHTFQQLCMMVYVKRKKEEEEESVVKYKSANMYVGRPNKTLLYCGQKPAGPAKSTALSDTNGSD